MKTMLGMTIFLMAWSTAVIGQCSDAEKKALEAFDKGWTAAGANGDKSALTAIYADDYAGFPSLQAKGPTIEATMAAFERNKTIPPNATTTGDRYIINCSPVSATVTHRNVTVAANGNTTYSRSVHILEKRGGKWQVVSNAGNALDDNATIWYLEQDWNDAGPKRDKAWFEKNLAADFSGVDASGKLSNKADGIADLMNDKGTLEFAETSDMNIRVDGNTAIVTGIYRTKGKDDKGVAYDRRSRFTDTWIKRDGRWQAWTTQGTIIQP